MRTPRGLPGRLPERLPERLRSLALVAVVAGLLLAVSVPPAHANVLAKLVAEQAADVATDLVVDALTGLVDSMLPVRYARPVAGAVLRAFEPPAHDYGPGHRGVDLAADVGAPVRAAARGTVRHAGAVVGVVWVSIDHPDGVTTSYGPLTALQVARGDDVARGDLLGVVAAGGHGDPLRDRGLHFGARRGDGYIDPLTLPGLREPRATLVGDGSWQGSAHVVNAYAPWAGGRLAGVLTTPSPVATAPGYAVPPNPNHLVLIAGLSSASQQRIVDATHLGIDPTSVTHLSYAGRDGAVDVAAGLGGPRRDQLPYGPEHTWEGVEAASAHLEAQLRAIAVREPGRAVDLMGHSMGGVVIAHYLLTRHDPYDRTLPPIAHVVTVASPLRGSDPARLGTAILEDLVSGSVVRGVWGAAEGLPGAVGELARSLDPDAPALAQLATGSSLLDDLEARFAAAVQDGSVGAFAMGTRMLSLAGSLDVLVLGERSAFAQAERRMLPGTHEGVLATEAVRETVWRFLAGREIVASPGHLATGVGTIGGAGLLALAATYDDVGLLPGVLVPLPISGRTAGVAQGPWG